MGREVHFDSAERRWAGLGPYYAMFPADFANRVVRSYTQVGELVLDPFAGRGTALFSAATQGRAAVGIEINPVGYVYAKTKLAPARHDDVLGRIRQISRAANTKRCADDARALPMFFRRCFAPGVRRFLVAARERLDWRRSCVDRTVMAILLVYLHGKRDAALSNQMRQTKSMSPQYAVRWWEERGMSPPQLDPVEFFERRLSWRYAKGVPECEQSAVYLGNCLMVLPRIKQMISERVLPKAKLLFTSPPYHGITNYHYDQWLRLWLLGGPPHAKRNGNGVCGKFENREKYTALLDRVFRLAKGALHRDATIYVRTDARRFTRTTTIDVLREVFPEKTMAVRRRPVNGATQTRLFGDFGKKAGEIDLVLEPK